ncbi:MAG: C10 family peptidase, partial [Muribaculaceae bacterium]|nr:C10 family peptidase [Muribaculaceae bacterium]
MKKIWILSAAALAAGLTADAARVSAVRAREIAASVLPTLSDAQPHRAPGTTSDSDTPYYVFNAPRQGGYVIVAGDDQLPAILGYSREGSLDLSDAPEALIALLQLSTDLSDISEEYTVTATGTPVVEPLLGATNWGQSEPFNNFCPMLTSSQRGYVGCVATAMAQIMKYYNYPKQGTGSHSYVDGTTSLSADFGATTYDWDNMPQEVPDSPTDAQLTAYSTLCAHLGVAVEMQYATSGSGAYTMMVPAALREYFGYSESIRMHSRSYYNTNEWMEIIRTELDAARPVYYAASSEDGLGGHAFVCDGYDSEGYVHINWGWYGRSNGYFYINHLNPGELGTGGGSGAYNISQEIITDFTPSSEGDIYLPTIYGATRFSCESFGNEMMIMTALDNLDTKPFEGEILAVLVDQDGEIAHTLKSDKIKVDPFTNGHSGSYILTMREVPTIVSDAVPAGKYRLNFAYKTDGMDQPVILRHQIGLPAYCNCTVRDGMILLNSRHQPVPVVTMTKPLETNGEIYAKGSVRLTTTLANESSDFRLTNNILTLKSLENQDLTFSKTYYVNIYEQSSLDVTMDFDLPDELLPGQYAVTLSHKGHEDSPYSTVDGKDVILTVLPEAESPVIRFVSMPIWQSNAVDPTSYAHGNLLMIAMSAKNFGGAGTTRVLCRLNDSEGHSYVLHATENSWSAHQTTTLTLSNYLTVNPGTYTPSFYYLDAAGNEKLITLLSEPEAIVVEANPDSKLEVTAFDIPSHIALGETVKCNLTLKGLSTEVGTLYVRVRQFTNKGGEIVFMKRNLSVIAGEEQTLSFNYKPGIGEGRYLVIVEFNDGNTTRPATGIDNYYREMAIGDIEQSGIEEITPDTDSPAEWYNLQGISIDQP